MPRITKALVDRLEPAAAGDRWAWDSEVPGFGVRVTPAGVKSYVIQYRNAQGRTRRLVLGRHGELTPDQARKLAATRRLEVRSGRDPAAERQAARTTAAGPATIADLVELWVVAQRKRVARGKLRGRSVDEAVRILERDVLPFRGPGGRALGRVPLSEFAALHARSLHESMAGRPALANRAINHLSAAWVWAEREGLIERPNPCRAVERNRETPRARHLSHAELRSLGAALERLSAERELRPQVASLVRVIALTGCRPGEIESLAWSDVDLERSVLALRAAKTGPRDVWLNEPARAELAALASRRRRKNASPFVFPSPYRPSQPIGDFRRSWIKLLGAAGIAYDPKAGPVPYVLRHTFASESEALGHSRYLTDELLGHAPRHRDTTRVYVHHVATDVRQASERVGRRIARLLAGEALERPGVVVPLHSASA